VRKFHKKEIPENTLKEISFMVYISTMEQIASGNTLEEIKKI
jgi:hypothetical protein